MKKTLTLFSPMLYSIARQPCNRIDLLEGMIDASVSQYVKFLKCVKNQPSLLSEWGFELKTIEDLDSDFVRNRLDFIERRGDLSSFGVNFLSDDIHYFVAPFNGEKYLIYSNMNMLDKFFSSLSDRILKDLNQRLSDEGINLTERELDIVTQSIWEYVDFFRDKLRLDLFDDGLRYMDAEDNIKAQEGLDNGEGC